MIRRWLAIKDGGDDAVVVTASGGLLGARAVELWSELEGAVDRAAGRLVVVDLGAVTKFDAHTIELLARVARGCRRRRVEFCAVIPPDGPLMAYASRSPLGELIPIHASVSDAVDSGLPAGPWC